MSEDLSAKIAAQKRIAIRGRNRLHWIILGSMIAGFSGAILWLWHFDSTRPGGVVGTAVTFAVFAGLLLSVLLHRHTAKCPQCGFDWTIDERSPVHMLTWHKCPGCGLEMIAEEKVPPDGMFGLACETQFNKAISASVSRKWIILILAILLIVYVGSYATLSAMGGYRFDQSGLVRYGFGLSVSDLEMWHPSCAWYQDDFQMIDGIRTSRGNTLGYFYSPLIKFDRKFIHKSRIVEETRK